LGITAAKQTGIVPNSERPNGPTHSNKTGNCIHEAVVPVEKETHAQAGGRSADFRAVLPVAGPGRAPGAVLLKRLRRPAAREAAI
jgi:hypothetical protein